MTLPGDMPLESQQHLRGVLQALLDADQEQDGFAAVDQPVVVGQGQVHHGADDDLVFDDDRARQNALVDAGWMPSSRQVGQSGKTVKPKVYLAFGISGAVQHLAGMKTSGTIIAVNSDPEAAIFGVAHFGATCDLFDVAEELEKLY